MYKVSVMYPNQEGGRFDFDYFCNTHMKLVMEHLKPYGLQRTAVDKGLSGGAGQKPPYVAIGNLYFDRADGYDEGIKVVGSALRGDIANYTDITPVRLISEVVDQ